MGGKENCKDTTNHLDTNLPSNGLKNIPPVKRIERNLTTWNI